jgi:hypothetical protein
MVQCTSGRSEASDGGGLDRMAGLSTAAARREREEEGKGEKGGGRRGDVAADVWSRLDSDSSAGRTWPVGLLCAGGLHMGRKRERAGWVVGGPCRGKGFS